MSNENPSDQQSLPELDKLWNHFNPGETEKKFRELLPAAETSGNPDYHIELLTQIARTEGMQSRHDDAHVTLDRAEALLTPDTGRPRVRYLLERGRTFNSSGKKDLAEPLFCEAWELAKSIRVDGLAVDAAHMIAIVVLDRPEESMVWNLRALEYAEKSDQAGARNWLGALYNNIGWNYFDKEQYPEALDLLEKALKWREENKTSQQSIFIGLWSIARVLRALGRVEEALAIQEGLASDYEKSELDSDGFVVEELAECKMELGQPGHEELFAQAHALLKDTWVAEHEPDHLARIQKLGKVDQN